MRIAVYPHDLAMGGSQLNAIEIAAAVNDLGHPSIVVGKPGPLVERIAELGLEFVELPPPSKRPSRRVAMALRKIAWERELDVIHGYEWPPTLEALWAMHGRRGAAVSTVMSMAIAPFIPKSLPLLVGTEQIAHAEREFGRTHVGLLEPPVDLATNEVDTDYGATEFRRRLEVESDEILIVVVTRLAQQLKLEGLLAAITAVDELRKSHRVRLCIVGDGPARDTVRSAAAAVNASTGSPSVILTGELADPRPAYAAADITLGMGGSALRAMAFAKPLVVQGESGFWLTLTPETVDQFLWTGWYGQGSGAENGVATVTRELRGLIDDAERRRTLGDFGLELVRSRFSVEAAARQQVDFYRDALGRRPPSSRVVTEELVSGLRYTGYYVGKRIRRARGVEQTDDFNARPLKAVRPESVEVTS